jgi:hypothetical protein
MEILVDGEERRQFFLRDTLGSFFGEERTRRKDSAKNERVNFHAASYSGLARLVTSSQRLA